MDPPHFPYFVTARREPWVSWPEVDEVMVLVAWVKDSVDVETTVEAEHTLAYN